MELTRQQKWMKAGAALVIASGLVVALGAHPATGEAARFFADLVLWPLEGVERLAGREARLLAAISGGLMAGWGWALWLLAGEGMARAPDLTRRIWIGSVLVWFVTDSSGSLAAGAPVNLIGNLMYLEILLMPLTWSGLVRKSA